MKMKFDEKVEAILNEAKKVTIDVDTVNDFAEKENQKNKKAIEKKFKVKIKPKMIGGSQPAADVTGDAENLLKMLSDQSELGWGMDIEDIEANYPELF
jgi:hypothetical protein